LHTLLHQAKIDGHELYIILFQHCISVRVALVAEGAKVGKTMDPRADGRSPWARLEA
jgi:hypothetical protein